MLTRHKICPWSPSSVIISFWEFDLVSQMSPMLKSLAHQKTLGIPLHSFLGMTSPGTKVFGWVLGESCTGTATV